MSDRGVLERRAPDPTLTALDGWVRLTAQEWTETRLAHRPGGPEDDIFPRTACGQVGYSDEAAANARFFAVPCLVCFPGGSAFGGRDARQGPQHDEGDPGLAWRRWTT
jgi:hypothetical protein